MDIYINGLSDIFGKLVDWLLNKGEFLWDVDNKMIKILILGLIFEILLLFVKMWNLFFDKLCKGS